MSYWKDRQQKVYLSGEMKINKFYKELERSLEQSKKEIQKVIHDFTMRYGVENNAASYADAAKRLSREELGTLEDFIDKAKKHMGEYNLELNNASIKARITRYEALLMQVDTTLQQVYGIDYMYEGEQTLQDIYKTAYNQTWFNIDQYHGFHNEFATIDARKIQELIRYPFDGATFSERIWRQKDYLLQRVKTDLTTMLVQGEHPRTLAKGLAKAFNGRESDAYRLLHTESSFIIEQATMTAYKEDDVEKYEYDATLDMRTCKVCGGLDGTIKKLDEAVVGVNYPPIHPYCRCTTVPYYEDDEDEGGTRIARDKKGKNILIPASMKYNEWYKLYGSK